MQQDTALEQRESCLSIRAAFDPLHFVDETFDCAVAPGQTTSIGHGLRIIGQPIDKSDQFGNPTGLDSGLPLLLTHLPLVLAQQTTKILRKRKHYGNGRVTLDKLLQIGCLLSRAALWRSHHHERNA